MTEYIITILGISMPMIGFLGIIDTLMKCHSDNDIFAFRFKISIATVIMLFGFMFLLIEK